MTGAGVAQLLRDHFFQVAYVVPDLAAAEEWFGATMGVAHFERLQGVELGATCRHRGAVADAVLDLSLGYLGDTQIELIRPGRGASLHAEFLAAGGRGLHHLGFAVPDFAAALRHLRSCGLQPVADGVLDAGMRVEFAYFECSDAAASVIEILGFDDAARAFMNDLRERGR